MTPFLDSGSRPVFGGDVDDDCDLLTASMIALGCTVFSRDEDDECYVDGDEPSCFNCRGRRWVRGGFSCMRELPRG